MFEVPLNAGPEGTRRAFLRELTGREEVLFTEARTFAASELVEHLLVEYPGGLRDVAALGVAERDRVLAELYLRWYGDRIDAVTTCGHCGETFGIDFSLGALVAAAARPSDQPLKLEGPDEQGVYRMPDGIRFRLPSVSDERELLGLSPSDSIRRLLERCIVEGDVERCAERVEAAMEALAPPLSTEVHASCALCGAQQLVSFDVVSFFSAAMARERPLLAREVHCLARAYGWKRDEIMALPRSERRDYVALVLAESDATRGGRA